MPLDNLIVEVIYVGNASTSTPYPVLQDYTDEDTIKCSKCAPGSGTVTVTAGVAVFSAAQASLIVGSRIRIGTLPGALDTIYEIIERTDNQNFKIRTLDTISASQFFLIDSATVLVKDTDFTLAADGIRTVVAVPATSIVLIWRATPLTNLLDIPAAGRLDQTAIMAATVNLTRQVQEIANTVNKTGLGALPPGAVSALLQDTATFTNAAARAAAVPSRIGQLGVQLDTNVVYRATGTAAGQWVAVENSPARLAANQAAVDAAVPAYIGEILIKIDDSSVWIAYGTDAGEWNLAWACHPAVWDRMPWVQGETVLPEDAPRWAGYFSRRFILESATVTVAQAGAGELVCRVLLPGTGRSVTLTSFTLSASDHHTKATADLTASVKGTLSADAVWEGGISPGEHAVVEIISAGNAQDFDATADSHSVTLNGGSQVNGLTGTLIMLPEGGSPSSDRIYVIENVAGASYGTAVLSHPRPNTAPESGFAGPRTFAFGVTGLGLGAGDTIIPCSAYEATQVKEGMQAVGPTVAPGTVVQAVTPGTPSFTLSKPLTGATETVTVIDPNRPPIQRLKFSTISSGATTGTIPHTWGIKEGDTLKGTNVAVDTYVTTATIPGTTLVWTPALTGDITQLWVFPAERSCTANAGDNIVPLSNVVGIKKGRKVSGPGVPEDTYLVDVAAPNVELSRSLTKDIAAEKLVFTRERCRHYGTVAQGSPNILLGYPISDTDIEAGQLITGLNTPGGTFVDSASGSTVVANNDFEVTGVIILDFHQNPAWKGLEVNLNGHHISTTPPR